MNRGELPSREAEAFRSWLQAAPANAEAFRDLEQAWRDLALVPNAETWIGAASSEYGRPGSGRPAGWGRRAGWMSALAACLVLAVGLLAVAPWRAPEGLSPVLAFNTATAETQTIELEDGSRVVLGAESSIQVAYTAGERNVVLKQGVAYFAVTPNAARPFVVQAAKTRVTVVGTEFETWIGPESIRVSVAEGRVRVGAPDGPASGHGGDRMLAAGEQVASTLTGDIGQVARFNALETFAWRSGRFIYTDIPLQTVIADINRYRRLKVEVTDPDLRGLQITAAFSASETESFLAGFAEAENARLEDRDGRTILSMK